MPETRVAVIAGCRTPFARSGTALKDLSAIDLGKACVRELLERSEVDPAAIGAVVMGQVVPSVQAPNLAREVGLGVGLPKEVPAHTVNRACASASQAIADVAAEIRLGNLEAGIAGGAESLSNVPIPLSRKLARTLVEAQRARGWGARLSALGALRPRDLVPEWPAVAEPSTGLTMGQSAEKMAKENGITREAQDRLALQSHQRAAAATSDGRLASEIVPWFGGRGMDEPVTADNGIRPDTSLEQLAKLKPVFDRNYGSVTAGNSSPLTDGAAMVLLMSDEKARALGYRPLAYLRSYAVAAVDPAWQLLMGPVFAVPKALERAGLAWEDVGLVEIHEAFAAQVLSNVDAWASPRWAERLGLHEPVGEVDWSRTNVMGGSIAIGHPFGATGARLVTQLANEMRRRGAEFGLISICAQGGMAHALVLEAA